MSNRVPSLEYVSVSKDALEFLKYAFFGMTDSPYKSASQRAYRDMCRTLRLGDADAAALRSAVGRALETEITAALETGFSSQMQFDAWHEGICSNISRLYRSHSVDLTVGQAQKWLNMTMKYLFILDAPRISEVFYFCHVPIDSYIIDAAEKQLVLKRPDKPWSKIDSYEEYAEYQRELRWRLKNLAPLEWEFKTWVAVATERNA